MQGKGLSVTQDLGLRLLQRQDNLAKGERLYDDVRLAQVASGRKTVEEVYPEYFTSEPVDVDLDDEAALVDPEATYDYSGVEWRSPNDMSPEELAEFAEFVENPVVTVSSKDVSEDGGWI